MKTTHELHAFDLDDTLIRGNSSFQFGVFLYRKGFLPFGSMLGSLGYYFLFRIGLISIPKLHQGVCDLFFRGQSLERLKELAGEYVRESHGNIVYPPCYQLFKSLDSSRQHVALFSSSPDFLVEAFARYFHIDDWAATLYHADKGKVVSVGKVMEGKEKAKCLLNLLKRLHLTKDKSVAYTDSILDLPFLEAAGRKVVVNPDRRLRQVAQKKQWEILSGEKQ